MITTKKHNKIVQQLKEEYTNKYSQLEQQLKGECENKCSQLVQQLNEARDLKHIIEKLYPLHTLEGSIMERIGTNWTLRFPDTVLQYTEDILGGKVIKQEGNKCIVIDKNGNVKTGLTKQKVDKGFNYKLVRTPRID